MRRCPSCRAEMRIVASDGLEIDACPSCGGFWLDAVELAPVLGEEPVERLFASAREATGRCKGCGEVPRPGLRECVRCGHIVTECPECGTRPLVVANVCGVNLDLCRRCSGVFFDPGELQLLARDSSMAARIQNGALAGRKVRQEPGIRIDCCLCGREMRKIHAFVDGDNYYCGSCCPPTASPVVAVHMHVDGSHDDPPGMSGYDTRGYGFGDDDGGLIISSLSALLQRLFS